MQLCLITASTYGCLQPILWTQWRPTLAVLQCGPCIVVVVSEEELRMVQLCLYSRRVAGLGSWDGPHRSYGSTLEAKGYVFYGWMMEAGASATQALALVQLLREIPGLPSSFVGMRFFFSDQATLLLEFTSPRALVRYVGCCDEIILASPRLATVKSSVPLGQLKRRIREAMHVDDGEPCFGRKARTRNNQFSARFPSRERAARSLSQVVPDLASARA
jgi:hypothetical protein